MGGALLRNCGLGLVAAAILAAVCVMASRSQLNVHPDELDHVNAGRYFIQYWDFPALDDPRLESTFSNYGMTYLQQPDIVYFLAGKFARTLTALSVPDYVALRFFDVGLFAVLMGLVFFLPGCRKLAFLPLFLSPQVWYVFSYFNGDAFPLFLSFVLVFLLARAEPPLDRLALSWRDPGLRRLVGVGLVLGCLAISKQNYYVLLAFVAAFLGLGGWSAGRFRAACRNGLIAFGVAGLLLAGRFACNAYINRGVRPEVKTHNAEQYAADAYKPSAKESGCLYWGLRMRDQGQSYTQIFTVWLWHIWTFRTSFGVYEYMKIYAPLIYYRYIGYLFWSLLAVLCLAVGLRGGRGGWPAVGLFLLFAGLTVFQSTWHSWVNDFQAQGRYLFPIAAMAGLTIARYAKAVAWSWPLSAPLAAGMTAMSFYSFVWVGLARLAT